MSRPSWFLVFFLVTCAAGLGVASATFSDWSRILFRDGKREIRETLNLEKFWAPMPNQTDAMGRNAIPCPDPNEALVLVTGGQSNAANNNTRLANVSPQGNVFQWFSGACYVGTDPMLGASGRGGSLWSSVGENLAQLTQRPVLLINGAIGGTQASDWLDDRSGYYHALNARVQSARDRGYEPSLIFWHQGETDAAVIHDMDDLKASFATLMDRLLGDMPEATLYLFQASKCIGRGRDNGIPAVTAALAEVAADKPRVVRGLNTDVLGNDYRWDTCHFNSLGRTAILEALIPDLEEKAATALR